MIRVLKGRHDDGIATMMDTIYKTFCGYVHADYAHIMEMYEGRTANFNLSGVPSVRERQMRMEYVEQTAIAVLYAAEHIANKLGLEDLDNQVIQALKDAGALDVASS